MGSWNIKHSYYFYACVWKKRGKSGNEQCPVENINITFYIISSEKYYKYWTFTFVNIIWTSLSSLSRSESIIGEYTEALSLQSVEAGSFESHTLT